MEGQQRIIILIGLLILIAIILLLIFLLKKDTSSDDVEWVAVGDGGTYGNIMHSSDGKLWEDSFSTGSHFSGVGVGVAYGKTDGDNKLWGAVGTDGTCYGNIMYSENGKEWTQTTTGDFFSVRGRSVSYSEKNGTPLWVAVGDDLPGGTAITYGHIMYSTNGKVWTQPTTGDYFSEQGLGVASNFPTYGVDKSKY